MEPVRIRVTRIIDFGTIVSIVGIDIESNSTVTVHVDQRPFQAIWEAWGAAGFPQPVEFDPENLTLNLDIHPDQEKDGVDHDQPPAA